MLRLSAGRLAQAVGGRLIAGSEDAAVTGVAIDSREVRPGAAFFALPGERTDGHAFLADALRGGARALVVTRDDEEVLATAAAAPRHETAVVLVPDAAEALSALARHHRARLGCPVIGVTGSTGKTTTKDLLFGVLSELGDVVATLGNRNNELGVPLTLLEAAPDTEAVVLEMAMRAPGQIGALCEIGRPTHGVITNVGQSHIEVLGSQEAIAEAKGELVACVPASGAVFLNGDDAWTARLAGGAVARVVRYGMGEANDVRAEEVTLDDEGRPSFTLKAPAGSIAVELIVRGRHNVYNACAAAAVGLDLGMSLSQVAEGLHCAATSPMRLEVFETATGVTVVNDAYNANPTSMRAALRTLADMAAGRRVAVLGDMAELGSLSELAHFQLGEEVARLGIDVLVTAGSKARRIAEGAAAEGMPRDSVRPCATVEEASEVLDDVLEQGDVVLVKASRVVGIERVVEGILKPHVQG